MAAKSLYGRVSFVSGRLRQIISSISLSSSNSNVAIGRLKLDGDVTAAKLLRGDRHSAGAGVGIEYDVAGTRIRLDTRRDGGHRLLVENGAGAAAGVRPCSASQARAASVCSKAEGRTEKKPQPAAPGLPTSRRRRPPRAMLPSVPTGRGTGPVANGRVFVPTYGINMDGATGCPDIDYSGFSYQSGLRSRGSQLMKQPGRRTGTVRRLKLRGQLQ